MNIYFIRHGDPDYSTDSLTELGHIQAKKLAESIKDLHIDEVYQSSMGRAQQTCSYSAEKWGLSPVTLDWARELCWGDKTGDAWASDSPWVITARLIEEQHRYATEDSVNAIPELEKDRLLEDMENRSIELDKFLEEHGYKRKGQLYYAENPTDKNIAIFCHGGVICQFLSHLINLPFFHLIAHVGLNVTSVTKVSFHGAQGEYLAANLNFLNDYHHLN